MLLCALAIRKIRHHISADWQGVVPDMTTTAVALSPAACRDARAFLDLTLEELATAAAISVSTLPRLERGETVSDYARKQIMAALEAKGASFIGGRPAGK